LQNLPSLEFSERKRLSVSSAAKQWIPRRGTILRWGAFKVKKNRQVGGVARDSFLKGDNNKIDVPFSLFVSTKSLKTSDFTNYGF
jgi:hypothetical protein